MGYCRKSFGEHGLQCGRGRAAGQKRVGRFGFVFDNLMFEGDLRSGGAPQRGEGAGKGWEMRADGREGVSSRDPPMWELYQRRRGVSRENF